MQTHLILLVYPILLFYYSYIASSNKARRNKKQTEILNERVYMTGTFFNCEIRASVLFLAALFCFGVLVTIMTHNEASVTFRTDGSVEYEEAKEGGALALIAFVVAAVCSVRYMSMDAKYSAAQYIAVTEHKVSGICSYKGADSKLHYAEFDINIEDITDVIPTTSPKRMFVDMGGLRIMTAQDEVEIIMLGNRYDIKSYLDKRIEECKGTGA